MGETWVRSLGWEDPLEKGKVTHSSILAWRTPWTVWSRGSQSLTRLSNFHSLCFQRSFIIQSFRVISEVIYFSFIQPAFKQHFQAPTMCYLWGHRVELDHCPLAFETLLTHPFSNARGALLCALAGIWGLVLGRKRAWLVEAGVNPTGHASASGKSMNPEKILLAPSMPTRAFFSVACRKTVSSFSSLSTMLPVVTW